MDNSVITIDLKVLTKQLLAIKKTLIAIFLGSFVLGYLFIFCIPRYYTCEIKLAPEYSTEGNPIKSITNTLGIDIGNANISDAISPTLYPILTQSNDFVVDLFTIKINNTLLNKKITYYDYLCNYQKVPFWASLFKKENKKIKTNSSINSFSLTKEQYRIATIIKNNIKCSVDRKTDVITFSVTDQDPVISAILADSVRCKLQKFITEYRTSKAQNDLKFFQKLTSEAKKKYEKARQLYATYSDANQDASLQSFVSKRDELENDMQLKFTAYNNLNSQLQNAKAKVQQRTPAFTVIQSASVPNKPTGPKRLVFAFSIAMVSLFSTIFFVFVKNQRKKKHEA